MLALGLALVSAAAPARGVTADDFRAAHFRGFNMAEVRDGVPAAADLDALAGTGANVGRVFVDLQRCALCSAYTLSADDLATLDALIAALAARAIKVIPVIVPAGDERGRLWNSVALQDSLVERWRELATRYQGSDALAGFDLVNEPVPPGRTYADRQSVWLDYALRLGTAIRAVDPDRVLIVESAPDDTPTSFVNLRPLPLKNIVYSVHSYYPMAVTHQGVMSAYRESTPYGTPTAAHQRRELAAFLDNVAGFAARYQVPILVGEFSCARWAPDGSSARFVADSLDLFEAHGWSWVYHEFRRWPGWDAEMDSGVHEVTRRSMDAPVMAMLRAHLSVPH